MRAPLLCAGIIGFRAISRAAVVPGSTVGLYGFGGSAHLAIQVLKHWKCRVFVMSRGGVHRDLAGELGADWIGDSFDRPPAPLDSAILFAPAGELVPAAMQALDRGGILAIAGIYLSPIPPLDYERDLFYEREIRSVTANTRADGEEFSANRRRDSDSHLHRGNGFERSKPRAATAQARRVARRRGALSLNSAGLKGRIGPRPGRTASHEAGAHFGAGRGDRCRGL